MSLNPTPKDSRRESKESPEPLIGPELREHERGVYGNLKMDWSLKRSWSQPEVLVDFLETFCLIVARSHQ